MARRRHPVVEVARRTGVIVPPELAIGPCAEVWGETGGPLDLLTARGRYSRARSGWETAEGLDGVTSYRLLPATGPWSVTGPHGPDRLARLGLSATDLPALRAAALERTTQTDPHTRKRTAP